MANITKATKRKIERINDQIKQGTDYSDIVKKEWQGSHKSKDKWIEKFKEHLSTDVLKALKYEDLEGTEDKQEEDKNTESTTKCILNFLEDKDNFRILQEMIEKYKNNENMEILDIPAEFITDTPVVKSIRMSEKIFDEFAILCKQYNLTIGACVNYALSQFIEKYKK